MKKIYSLILLGCIVLNGFAQSFKSESSELYDENIGIPVLLMKDGSTVFQGMNNKSNKMALTVYDKDHKVLFMRKEITFKNVKESYSVDPKTWHEKDSKIVFYGSSKKKDYRIVIDPKTLLVIEDIQLDCYPENKEDYIMSMQFSESANSVCTEEKGDGSYKAKLTCSSTFDMKNVDPISGNSIQTLSTRKLLSKEQALARTNFDDIQTYGFKIFDSNCQETQNVQFDYVNKKFNDVSILATYIYDNMIYFICSYNLIIDRASYDSNKGFFYITKYNISTKKFTHQEVFEIKNDKGLEKVLIYPSVDKSSFTLNIKEQIGEEFKNNIHYYYYDIYYVNFDAQSLKVANAYRIATEKSDNLMKTSCVDCKGIDGGMTDKAILDKKNNVVMTKVHNLSFSYPFKSNLSSYGNPEVIGMSVVNNEGKEMNAWAMNYNVYGASGSRNPAVGNFAYTIASGSKNYYILMNDLAKNIDVPANKKPAFTKEVDQCEAFIVELLPNGEIQKNYLLPKSLDKKANKYGDFGSVLYDKATNTIVLRVYEGEAFRKTRAVWVKLD